MVVAWLFGVSPTNLSVHPVSAATKPKAGANWSDGEVREGKIKLNYYSASWARVLQDLAATNDMEVIADHLPKGRFSRIDRTEYTRKEAMRIINREIEPQGLRLIEKGQFLIMIETTATRPQYAPAVLPKKNAKIIPEETGVEEEEVVVKQSGFQAETIVPAKDERPVNANQEIIAKKSQRYTARDVRPEATDADSASEKPVAPRKLPASRAVRQTAHEEFFEEPEVVATPKKVHPFDSKAPAALEKVGAPAQPVTFRTRHLPAVDLSKRVYRAMKSSAELVDSGRNGLPAFRVSSKPAKSIDTNKTNSPDTDPVEFMISIDEAHDELLIDGNKKNVEAVLRLLKVLDQPDDGQTQTHIKASSKYVCQVAEQLPAEIDRIRAARGTDVKSRLAQADGGDDRFPAEKGEVADLSMGGALGNFKGEVNIQVIEDLNVMVIIGNERDVAQVEQVIKQIEQLAVATAPRVELLQLKNVDSESLAELLTTVYERLTRFPGKGTQPRESVAIIPITKPNSLMIIAPGLKWRTFSLWPMSSIKRSIRTRNSRCSA